MRWKFYRVGIGLILSKTVSEGDITFLYLSGVDDSSQNNFEEIKIINDTIDNSTICKDYYSNIFANIDATFHLYLQKITTFLIEKMEENLILNHYSLSIYKINTIQKRLCILSIDFSLLLGDFLQLTILLLFRLEKCLVLSSLATLFNRLKSRKNSTLEVQED